MSKTPPPHNQTMSAQRNPALHLVTEAKLDELEARDDDLVIITDRPHSSFFWPDRACSAIHTFDGVHSVPCCAHSTAHWRWHVYVLPQRITQRYDDAFVAFADVLARFETDQVTHFVQVRGSDAGLPRYAYGSVPPAIRCARVFFERGALATASFFFDEEQLTCNWEQLPPTTPQALHSTDLRLSATPSPLASKMHAVLAPMCTIVLPDSLTGQPFALEASDYWQDGRGLHFSPRKPCSACATPTAVCVPIASLPALAKRWAPATRYSAASGRPRRADEYIMSPPDHWVAFGACYCEVLFVPLTDAPAHWLGVRDRLIALTMALCAHAALEARLSEYPVLWIFDRLPGALCFGEREKLDVILAVLASIRRVEAARASCKSARSE